MSVPSTSDTITWRLHLASPPGRVFELLSTDDGRARFWAESAIERDGIIQFEFINGMATHSRVLASDPPRRFVIEYFDSRVEFVLESDRAGGTDLTMTNTGFDPSDRDDILPGWLNVLFPLKGAADHGIDLRNHDPSRTWEKGYVDQ